MDICEKSGYFRDGKFRSKDSRPVKPLTDQLMYFYEWLHLDILRNKENFRNFQKFGVPCKTSKMTPSGEVFEPKYVSESRN